MYALKMDTGKELITTVRQSVYQGEKNADDLLFLVPKMYDNIDIASYTVLLQYVLPGSDVYADLELTATEHNAEYLAYSTPLDFPITAFSGTVWMRLQIKDADGHVVLVSGTAALPVLCRTTGKPDEPSPDKDKLARLAEQVELLSKEKADSLVYDPDTQKLQLTAEGVRIGDAVTIQLNGYEGTYEVTPGIYEEVTLPTKSKTMKDDVTVLKIPQYEVSNEAGGNTLIMGDEYYGG